MEVLYHIRSYFVRIFPYIGLIYARYLQFRFLKWPLKLWYRACMTMIVYPLGPPGTALPRGLHIFWGMNTNVPGFADCPTHGFSLWSTKGQKYVTSLVIYPSMLGCWNLPNHVGKDICNSYYFVDRNQLRWTAPFKKRENTHIVHAYVLYIYIYMHTNIIEIYFMICKIHICIY